MDRSKYWSWSLTELFEELKRRNNGCHVPAIRDGQFMIVTITKYDQRKNVRAEISGAGLFSATACANLLDYLDEIGIQ